MENNNQFKQQKLTRGPLVKQRRKELKLTQEQLADMLGVRKSAISKFESGDSVNMRIQNVEKLAQILRLHPADILGIDMKAEEHEKDMENLSFAPVPIYARTTLSRGDVDKTSEAITFAGVPVEWTVYGREYFGTKDHDDGIFEVYDPNEVLVFEKTDKLEPGKIGAFTLNGRYYLRRIREMPDGTRWLFADNPDMDPVQIENEDEFRVLGRLRFIMSRLKNEF